MINLPYPSLTCFGRGLYIYMNACSYCCACIVKLMRGKLWNIIKTIRIFADQCAVFAFCYCHLPHPPFIDKWSRLGSLKRKTIKIIHCVASPPSFLIVVNKSNRKAMEKHFCSSLHAYINVYDIHFYYCNMFNIVGDKNLKGERI